MCKVYNQIGCLTQIQNHLRHNGLNANQSPHDLLDFQKSHLSVRQQILSNHRTLIKQERDQLDAELPELQATVQTARGEIEGQLSAKIEELRKRVDDLASDDLNVIQSLINQIKKVRLKYKISRSEGRFNARVEIAIRHLVEHHKLKNERYQFISSKLEDAIRQSSLVEIQEHDRKKNVIDLIKNEIFGALGELQVESELKKLPDDYILINDFSRSFDPAIYNRKEDDHIQSIQIDHLLIAPSGIFLIETKNWSDQSLNNLNFRSPVQQVKRTNFALFVMLNVNTRGTKYIFTEHPWGEKKIPIRNVIVFINRKPTEEFQHVKTLTLNELLGYVRYFKPCFSDIEMRAMAGYLIALNVK